MLVDTKENYTRGNSGGMESTGAFGEDNDRALKEM